MRIQRGANSGVASFPLAEHFSGSAWMDLLLQSELDQGTGGVVVATVTFTPGARTDWHRHESGQLLVVLAGQGWVGSRSGECSDIYAGDLVWTPGGEDHWHGATDATSMVHLSVTLGETLWHDEPVTTAPVRTPPEAMHVGADRPD
jgi:quercetin dioxygenase-like cupin family protein